MNEHELISSLQFFFSKCNSYQIDKRRAELRRAHDYALQDATTSLAACMEHVGDGVILLDSHLRVFHITDSALRLLETCKDSISVRDNHLNIADPDKARDLCQFAKSAFLSDGDCMRRMDTFFIERPTSEPLIASAFALPSALDPSLKRFMLILRDLGHSSEPNWTCFADRFQLTKAELQLCISLTNGLNIAEHSEKFHISPNTARSQLKKVFGKTCTHSQVQLQRLIFAFVHS